MFIFSLFATILIALGVVLLFGLTPKIVADDILKIISPKRTLKDMVRTAQGKKKSIKLTAELKRINDTLIATGKSGQFATICAASLSLLICGGVFSVLIDNVFLMPILAIALTMIPFVYAKTAIGYYEKHIDEEIETALSIITTSYIRNQDIVTAVRENISYLKPPINSIFKSFLGEATAINSDIKKALYRLKDRIDNEIFKEWVDTLIQCQDDRTLNDTLLPVVGKLSDVRIVNNELKTMLSQPRKEFYMMVALVIGNIPLLYTLNRDWFETLMFSTPGKIVLALCGGVILITTLFMMKYTKPIEYRK